MKYFNIYGEETYCLNEDIKYITNRIYENYKGVFEEISFWVKEHTKTYTLHIDIEGYRREWNLKYELDKSIKSLATEINEIIKYINENT